MPNAQCLVLLPGPLHLCLFTVHCYLFTPLIRAIREIRGLPSLLPHFP